jgi:hypothetical protein
MAKEKMGPRLKMGIGKRRFLGEEMGSGKGYGLRK